MSSTGAPEPRLVRYTTPSAFLRACLPFDTWHMNIAFGTSLQLLAEVGDAEHEPSQPRLWLTVWTGEELDLALVRTSTMVTFCSPKHTESLSPAWLSARMQLLASSLHELISTGSQPAISSITGATVLVDAWTPHYAALSGLSPEGAAILDTIHTHCPRDRVSHDPPKLPEGHAIRIVQPGDMQALAHLAKLLQAFRNQHPGPGADITLEQAAKLAEVGIRFKEFLLYMVKDAEGKEECVAYLRDGRITLRHAAVRNVFTLPHFRRRGIAEALTRAAVVRLLAEPHRMQATLAPLLPADVAELELEDVCIFAEKSNPGAQGVYKRVGYGFPGGDWEEEDGKSWEECVELGYPGDKRNGS